ncbi:DUF5710 domain-containing protein [Aeromonas veronii]
MRIPFGLHAGAASKQQERQVAWDSREAINGHMLLLGMSGAGKTHQLRRMISSLLDTASPQATPRIHIFDIHGDIEIPSASTVLFSEQSGYGLNPLVVDSDPHFGGVRKKIQGFISTLNKTSRQLGGKQEAVLRNLLTDVYEAHGFVLDDPTTWVVNPNDQRLVSVEPGRFYIDVPIAEKDDAKALGARWDGAVRSWFIPESDYTGDITSWPPKRLARTHPSIEDVLRHARHILKRSFFGCDQKSIVQLGIANKAAQAMRKKLLDAFKNSEYGKPDSDALEALEKAKEKAQEAYANYVESITTGFEIESVMKYDSMDVLKSVIDRLENLNAIGIFKSEIPPFEQDNPLWRYQLQALSMEERKLFVLFRLAQLFTEAVKRGEQAEILDVIILDEGHVYTDDDPDNIINTIAKEARKFGLALIIASQNPNHFPDDFITSVGTKIILGIDESHWAGAMRKMRLTEKELSWIKLQSTCMVQIKQRGATKNEWQWTLLKERL